MSSRYIIDRGQRIRAMFNDFQTELLEDSRKNSVLVLKKKRADAGVSSSKNITASPAALKAFYEQLKQQAGIK